MRACWSESVRRSTFIRAAFVTVLGTEPNAAELAAAAERNLGSLHELMARGEFRLLLEWLRSSVHRLGQTYRGHELIEKAIGRAPDARALIDHLMRKGSALKNS